MMKYEYIISTVTVIIGLSVATVAIQQYKLAKDRLRLDLFEKRFAVYKGVQVFLTSIMAAANVDLEKFYQFRAETQDSVFLFEDEIPNFIKEIGRRALDVHTLASELEGVPKGEERTRIVQEKSEHVKWLVAQLPELKMVFSPYLKFKAWS